MQTPSRTEYYPGLSAEITDLNKILHWFPKLCFSIASPENLRNFVGVTQFHPKTVKLKIIQRATHVDTKLDKG